MEKKRLIIGILVFGSLWGFSECIIGSMLHDAGLPAGAVMTGIVALGLMCISRFWFQQKGMQLGMGLVAGTMRLCNPFGGCFICSAFAIMAEGVLFEILWYKLMQDPSKLQCLKVQVSMGIVGAYTLYVGGYIITQILTPIVSSAGFYLENLVIFIPSILASGLLAAVIGSITVPAVYALKKMDIRLKDTVYYPVAISVSFFCWFIVIINTMLIITSCTSCGL